MGLRDEILFDQQFFGGPASPSAVQRKIIEYIAGVAGGVMITLNCVYYLKKELEQHAPEVAAKLGLTKANDQGVEDVESTSGSLSGNDSGSNSF